MSNRKKALLEREMMQFYINRKKFYNAYFDIKLLREPEQQRPNLHTEKFTFKTKKIWLNQK